MNSRKSESTQKGKLLVLTLKRDRFLKTEDVAKWLSLSARTVTELAERWQDGDPDGIPSFKVGRSWRFEAEHLEAWVAQKQQPSASNAAFVRDHGSADKQRLIQRVERKTATT